MLGALVNSVLLIALCFTIFVDAIQRLVSVETIENPVLILIVGSVGLVVNGIGLCLFGAHGESRLVNVLLCDFLGSNLYARYGGRGLTPPPMFQILSRGTP